MTAFWTSTRKPSPSSRKQYRGKAQPKSRRMRLEGGEFLRRSLIHVLADGSQRIRHFGFLANRRRQEKLTLCRPLLSAPIAELLPDREQCAAALAAITQPATRRCPACGAGEIVRLVDLPACRWPARPNDTS